jgi:hypothetical protein
MGNRNPEERQKTLIFYSQTRFVVVTVRESHRLSTIQGVNKAQTGIRPLINEPPLFVQDSELVRPKINEGRATHSGVSVSEKAGKNHTNSDSAHAEDTHEPFPGCRDFLGALRYPRILEISIQPQMSRQCGGGTDDSKRVCQT